MGFKNDAQRKAAFANMGNSKPKLAPVFTRAQYTDGNKNRGEIKINSILDQKEQIRVMFEWGGCAITPQYCALIKGINLAYKIYRTDNNDMVKEIAKIIASDVVPIVSEYQVDACSNKIVEQINDYGLIDNISKQTNLDKSVFQDMMKGTISNLLNAGMKNHVNSTIDKMWSP